jgi:hypothetical protein
MGFERHDDPQSYVDGRWRSCERQDDGPGARQRHKLSLGSAGIRLGFEKLSDPIE